MLSRLPRWRIPRGVGDIHGRRSCCDRGLGSHHGRRRDLLLLPQLWLAALVLLAVLHGQLHGGHWLTLDLFFIFRVGGERRESVVLQAAAAAGGAAGTSADAATCLADNRRAA